MQARAFGSYEGALRGLIHLLKYEQVQPAAKMLGRLLAATIAEMPLQGRSLLVVPVPLHKSKARQRGFNQAEQIARAALKVLPGHLVLNSRLLERQRATESQIGLTRHQRRENLRGAFRVVLPEEVRSRGILLVDDVFTTGTTVSECTRVLRRAGASNVWVATVARTLKEEVRLVSAQAA
jgi:ComF family protein